jgi:hypothetical protein
VESRPEDHMSVTRLIGTGRVAPWHNLVMNLIWAPSEERIRVGDWSLTWSWPADARKIMFWIFVLSPLLSVANILRSWSLHRLYWFPVWRNMLLGPLSNVLTGVIWLLAASHLWKGKGWAIAASLLFFAMYFRQFIVAVRPTRSHGLVTLSIGMIGLISFAWPDKQVDLPPAFPNSR